VNRLKIIKPSRVRSYMDAFPEAAQWLGAWLKITKRQNWSSLAEVRQHYPHADAVKVRSGRRVTVFNVCGNKYRLIVAINYSWSVIYVLRFLTHVRYDKDKWKQEL
jgi:mRNA interferase HigB